MAYCEIVTGGRSGGRGVLNFSDLFSIDNKEQIVISDSGYVLCDVTTGKVVERLEDTIIESKKKLKKLGKDKSHPIFMNL